MNRYEVGVRDPDYELVCRLGKVLKVPAAYFYALDDREAELLQLFASLSAEDKTRVIGLAAELKG